ncbi:uncharacterized protein CMC5_023820 [Chondromyces crocatus]|uniref:Uncharacterized protein n=1 Tax=Chondromyces crocatus TaxID=52 RepID=A0A0K1EBL1_CHOCO|nr:uncharacterized protein CMC5_023820 [Chondromyces crocatus]
MTISRRRHAELLVREVSLRRRPSWLYLDVVRRDALVALVDDASPCPRSHPDVGRVPLAYRRPGSAGSRWVSVRRRNPLPSMPWAGRLRSTRQHRHVEALLHPHDAPVGERQLDDGCGGRRRRHAYARQMGPRGLDDSDREKPRRCALKRCSGARTEPRRPPVQRLNLQALQPGKRLRAQAALLPAPYPLTPLASPSQPPVPSMGSGVTRPHSAGHDGGDLTDTALPPPCRTQGRLKFMLNASSTMLLVGYG